MEYLSTSVEYMTPPWNIEAIPWNVSYLFDPFHGTFDTSVEYFIRPYNV